MKNQRNGQTTMELYQSPVIFTPEPHGYHIERDGRTIPLKGVTGILAKHLFPRKYDGVDEATLNAAAERGSRIHENCYAVGVLGVAASPEAEAFRRLMTERGFTEIAHEYTVSDEEHVASNIDLVLAGEDGRVCLADIKTTSHFDDGYVAWQLSVYKYLFALHNPDIEVGGLYGVWLPRERYGKPRVIKAREIPEAEVRRLLECDRRGETYAAPAAPSESVAEIAAARASVTAVFRQIKELEERKKQLTAALYAAMEAHDIKKWECDDFTLTRTPPTERAAFDGKAFKEKHPDLYAEFTTTAKVAGGVRITLK